MEEIRYRESRHYDTLETLRRKRRNVIQSSFILWAWHLTLGMSSARKPERRRSVATVLVVKGAFVYFLVLHLLRLPGCPMFQHSIENGQQLMHTRGQGDFFDFPRREEPFVKNVDLRVEARSDQRAHV